MVSFLNGGQSEDELGESRSSHSTRAQRSFFSFESIDERAKHRFISIFGSSHSYTQDIWISSHWPIMRRRDRGRISSSREVSECTLIRERTFVCLHLGI